MTATGILPELPFGHELRHNVELSRVEFLDTEGRVRGWLTEEAIAMTPMAMTAWLAKIARSWGWAPVVWLPTRHPAPLPADLTWADVAARVPHFVQWVAARFGPLPDGAVVEADFERFRAAYQADL